MRNVAYTRIVIPVLLAMACTVVLAEDPYQEWWFSGQVIVTNAATTNDYGAVNQGQLKWIAERAYIAISNACGVANDVATNGFPSASATIAGFKVTNNYQSVNIGQVKYRRFV